MQLKLVVALGFLGFIGCPGPTRAPDAPGIHPIKPPDTDLCGKMCQRIGPQGLKCEEGMPVYDSDQPGPVGVPNVTCEAFCRTSQDRGSFFNPRCVALVRACSEIEAARKRLPSTCVEP